MPLTREIDRTISRHITGIRGRLAQASAEWTQSAFPADTRIYYRRNIYMIVVDGKAVMAHNLASEMNSLFLQVPPRVSIHTLVNRLNVLFMDIPHPTFKGARFFIRQGAIKVLMEGETYSQHTTLSLNEDVIIFSRYGTFRGKGEHDIHEYFNNPSLIDSIDVDSGTTKETL